MYIKPPSNYPYSLAQLRRDTPDTSYPSQMDDAALAEHGVFRVTPVEPPGYEPATQNIAEALPVEIEGEWVQRWSVTEASPEEVTARADAQAAAMRADRNERLRACDWTQVPDAPLDPAPWVIYRQALRDITLQAGFPYSIEWPEAPAE